MGDEHRDDPTCPTHGRVLVCPSCRAAAAGRLGGLVKTEAKRKAAKRTNRRPEERAKRSATMLAHWARLRGEEPPPDHPPAEPAAQAPPLEPAAKNANPGSDQIANPGARTLAEALAKRRGD